MLILNDISFEKQILNIVSFIVSDWNSMSLK